MDDKFIYISYHSGNEAHQFAQLQLTLDNMTAWLGKNMLKINPTKCEFMIVPSRSDLGNPPNVIVDGHQLSLTNNIKFLGVAIDRELSLKPHILQLCRTSSWQLSEIRRVRKRLDKATTEMVIRAFVTSRPDYCNSLYYRLPAVTTNPLTRILNTAARIVSMTRRFDHITPVLHSLHWVPIRERIIFKVSCMVFLCLSGKAPFYLSNTLRLCDSDRLVARRQLQVPLRSCDSFSCFGPSVWNSLPSFLRSPELSLTSFKKLLKTELFRRAYNHNL